MFTMPWYTYLCTHNATTTRTTITKHHPTRAEGESVGEGNEENRLMMAGNGGEEWGAGAKDRQQATFSQPEQSYEAAFNKVCHWLGFGSIAVHIYLYITYILGTDLSASNFCAFAG